MPTLSWTTDRRGGVTLVDLRIHNDTTDHRRIRVENRLDGPVPAAEEGAFTCRLAPGERCALEYATSTPPAEPLAEPPAELVRSTVVGAGADATDPYRADGGSTERGSVALPPAVAAWLAAVERRVDATAAGNERAERIGHATVIADRDTLAALERRAAAIRGRLASTVPERDPTPSRDGAGR